MSLQTRNSVAALKKEVTEGTPVSPTLATDFIAQQDDLTLSPSFVALDNVELTGTIGKAKSVKGIEEPTASLSHYLRHSGIEGQAPNYIELLESAMGLVTSRATERDTVAASTVSVIKVDAGEGVEFVRGDGILVKNPIGYEIRNVLSVATDDLTLTQNLVNAPGVGVNLGKNVLVSPLNTGHPTFTFWEYRGNAVAGAVEMMAGSRVISASIDIPAGEFINGNYNFDGISYYFDPAEITATDIYLDFNDGGGEENAVISAKFYKDPYELASAVEVAMNALTGDTITVSYDDLTGKYTIATDGGTLSLLWNTGANTANTVGDKLGFDVAADDTLSTGYLADNVISKIAPFTPTFDATDPLVAKSNEVLLGDAATEITCFQASVVNVLIDNTKTDVLSICSESGKAGSAIAERVYTVTISALLEDHQAKEFKNFRENDKMFFTYNGGKKTGGNWTAGTCINIHSPAMVIDQIELSDNGGLVQLDMTLSSFVENGLAEFYINFL